MRFIRNERGVTFPLALSIFFLFFLFVMTMITFYEAKTRIFHQGELLMQQDYYINQALKYMNDELLSNSECSISGELPFLHGVVSYNAEPFLDDFLQIHVLILLEDKAKLEGFAYYDCVNRELFKWVELQ